MGPEQGIFLTLWARAQTHFRTLWARALNYLPYESRCGTRNFRATLTTLRSIKYFSDLMSTSTIPCSGPNQMCCRACRRHIGRHKQADVWVWFGGKSVLDADGTMTWKLSRFLRQANVAPKPSCTLSRKSVPPQKTATTPPEAITTEKNMTFTVM